MLVEVLAKHLCAVDLAMKTMAVAAVFQKTNQERLRNVETPQGTISHPPMRQAKHLAEAFTQNKGRTMRNNVNGPPDVQQPGGVVAQGGRGMTDYTDLKARLAERAAIARGENTGTALGDAIHFEQAAAAIAALEADIARLQTAHVQMQRAHDDLAAENARLRGALTQIAGEASVPVHTWKNGINFKKMYEGWRKIATERIDIARAALTAPTSGC